METFPLISACGESGVYCHSTPPEPPTTSPPIWKAKNSIWKANTPIHKAEIQIPNGWLSTFYNGSYVVKSCIKASVIYSSPMTLNEGSSKMQISDSILRCNSL